MLGNADLQESIESKSMCHAFYMLSYLKKLCLHPHLLTSTPLESKRNLGIITEDEEKVLDENERLRAEEEAAY